MNIKKLNQVLYKMMLIILLGLILYVTYCSIFNIYGKSEDLKPFIIILGTIIIMFLCIRIKRYIDKIDESLANKIAIIICIAFFIILAIIGCTTMSIPTNDMAHIEREANVMIENGGKFENLEYFQRYSAQSMLVMMVYFIYKIGNLFNFNNLRLFTTIVNSIGIGIMAFFTYLSVKEMKGYKLALNTLMFLILNPIFYMYSSFYYTDTLCMPFSAIGIYLYIISIKNVRNIKSNILLILAGIFLAIGMKIRVVIGILLIGIIIQRIFLDKFDKKILMKMGSLVGGFILGIVMCTCIFLIYHVPKDKEIEFPITHWVMMGMNEVSGGAFTPTEYGLTCYAGNYEQKKSTNIEVIKYRLESFGIRGLISLYKKKININWANGECFYINNLLNVEDINWMYEYIAGNKKIYLIYYLQIMRVSLLIITILSIIKQLKNCDEEMKFINISIFGAFLFYLIWEVSSRYSLTFLPWFMLIYSIGIQKLDEIFKIKHLNVILRDNKKQFINVDKLKRNIAISTIMISMILIILNYNYYAVDKSIYYDKRVSQQGETDKINIIKNKEIVQTFSSNKSFNTISIKFLQNSIEQITNYSLELYNQKEELICNVDFTSEEINGDYKEFNVGKVKPIGNESYKIIIKSNNATEENSLGICIFGLENYDIYPGGTLTIEEEEISADITFKVENKIKRSYVSKKVYVILSMVIIIVEVFAFSPYLKKRNELQ